jgi:hypothetical protein
MFAIASFGNHISCADSGQLFLSRGHHGTNHVEVTRSLEDDMAGILIDDGREPRSELKVADLLSALAFGASFEEIANFLIDNIAERDIDLSLGLRSFAMSCSLKLFPALSIGVCNRPLPGEAVTISPPIPFLPGSPVS